MREHLLLERPTLDERPNLLYDTSWWTVADFMALFSLVPPGRILIASDAPYGSPAGGFLYAMRCALQAGLRCCSLS